MGRKKKTREMIAGHPGFKKFRMSGIVDGLVLFHQHRDNDRRVKDVMMPGHQLLEIFPAGAIFRRVLGKMGKDVKGLGAD